jgi:hypothetical protein
VSATVLGKEHSELRELQGAPRFVRSQCSSCTIVQIVHHTRSPNQKRTRIHLTHLTQVCIWPEGVLSSFGSKVQ